MKAVDRARLTAALRDHVAKIAADLRAQMRAEGPVRERARKLHRDEQVGEDFDVWTDLLSRRAAVLWVLKSVYVRVLEDRGLVSPGRLLDREAQQLFEQLAPNLGETAFLRWVYRDLASRNGGLPELFSPQPAEVALPADALSRALIEFWRHEDADTGACWSFADERFEGELMGDLYQDLDPVVKDRFALCQTPEFVRSFILDRTLTPAIEEFGAETVRLIDPACGSGHFLIDGLKRLALATAHQHPEWERGKVVRHCLDRVIGIDLNDYACALARARLVMTAAELAGVEDLAQAAQYHPRVYWADGLEQVECAMPSQTQQLSLFGSTTDPPPLYRLTPYATRSALSLALAPRFHVVVMNPPYMVEKDEKRKSYHREKMARRPRYISAHGQYSLGAVFIERALQLAQKEGFVGLITSNNFMTRKFGKPLIQKILATVDLTLIADTSLAIIAPAGSFETPTVMLFVRNRKPTLKNARVVMAKKGDTARLEDPSKGPVWSSIVEGWDLVGFENEYVSVANVSRETLAKYPWSFRVGSENTLREKLEQRCGGRLKDVVDGTIGRGARTGDDEIFVYPNYVAKRLGFSSDWWMSIISGHEIRDWKARKTELILYPYDKINNFRPKSSTSPESNAPLLYLWRYRSRLESRATFQGDMAAAGLLWYEYQQYTSSANETAPSICFPAMSTHNNFALDRGGSVFNRSAPIIKLPIDSSMDDYLHLLGALNSSIVAFWLRQKLHRVGGRSSGTRRQSEPWAQRLDFASELVAEAPLTMSHRARIVALAKRLDNLATDWLIEQPTSVLERDWSADSLQALLAATSDRLQNIRKLMVALQEELDWTLYAAFDIAPDTCIDNIEEIEPIASEHRPFAIRLAQSVSCGDATNYWFEALGTTPAATLPSSYSARTQEMILKRIELTEASDDLAHAESPECKRKWEPFTFTEDVAEAGLSWLANQMEAVLEGHSRPVSLSRIASAVQQDPRFMALCTILQARIDVDVERAVNDVLSSWSVPNHPFHTYTNTGLEKRQSWEEVWAHQRLQDEGQAFTAAPRALEYSQGSRGKSVDFIQSEYWKVRGPLDIPRERFIAFTEIPGRSSDDTLYGWAGWTPLQRLKALLAIDEDLEDQGVPLTDRVGLLDSAWRLLPWIAQDDPAAANRLKAELQAVVGEDGPSREMLDDWRRRFPPPGTRPKKTRAAG